MEHSVFIHPAAIVEDGAYIGSGTKIWAFAHILSGASIGRDCVIGDHCFVESGVSVGDDVTIKNNIALWEGITVQDSAFIGPAAVFTNDKFPRSPRSQIPGIQERYKDKTRWLIKTCIGRGASIGARAVILSGCHIGDFSLIAAAAVVTQTVPAYALMVGIPARRSGWVCECGLSLTIQKDYLMCNECKRTFQEEGEFLIPSPIIS